MGIADGMAVRGASMALVLAAAAALGQELPPSTLPVGVPATMALEATSQPATAPAATQPVAASRPVRPYDPNAKVTFNFKDASADAVLEYLSDSLGFIIIRDGRVEGRVTMMSRQALGADDAADLLNSALRPINYTAIRTGRALRIVSRDKAKKANIPVRFGADPRQIPVSDEIVTQVIPLSQLDAVKLKQDLQNLFSAEADVTTNAASNTLIVTDTSANINRIAQIISTTDKHMAATADIRTYPLQYASAANAAKLINEVFKTDTATTNQQNQGGRRFNFGMMGGPGGFPGMPGVQATGATEGRSTVKVVASSDDRTNMLVVSGPSEVLPVIDRVVKELDSNHSETTTVFVYPLRNGQAAHLQDVLNSLFGTGTGTSGTRTTGTGTRSTYTSTSGRTGATGNSAFGSRTSSGGMGLGSSGSFGASSMGSSSSRVGAFGAAAALPQLSAQSRAALGDLAGQVYVVADTDTNSLIVTTSPLFEDRIRKILTELDHPVPQVLIKVLLAEVTHENGLDIGAEGSILNKRDNGNGQSIGTDFGLAQQTGGMVVSFVEKDFQATLRALATEGKVEVLSRPYILASDNQLASILVGQEVPFVTNTRVTDTGQTINTVEYRDIGIMLDVTPHINPDGKVIMDVAPEISALLKDANVQITDTVSAPVFSKRSAQSRVAIDNGRTIVIGGLMEDRKDSVVKKVPLLGDVPLLGALFRRTQDTKRKTELLIFLTPHVAMDSSALKDMSKDEMQGVKIVPDAVKPGTFQQQMEGMRRGSTTAPSEPIYVPAPIPDAK